ncbi:3-ketoacyl-ACP reductase [Paramesorhizobium deserti]|uniref:3-ketoacyl-ACP reductase n=1 Tax=Paramesorhizobium deserti TaxID=1494590 RepID=A0A135I1X0_9HYPH|nr:3-oxoacyl-ACP reductase FabG [Paramesorhizobium deserti]KXF79431.1 3-ketoacyl-ACP reductase [Paramesorhizobium deserti]
METQKSRVAVVTGGSSGIGLATVSTLLGRGHRVAFFGQNEEHVRTAQEELSARFGAGNLLARTVDLAKGAQIDQFFQAVEDHWSAPEILVCNAGISPKGPAGPVSFSEMPLAEWNAVLCVNLTGSMLCCQAVLAKMRGMGFGRIVFVGSIAGRTVPKVAGTAYAASKAALAGLARSLVAASAGHGITVNVVAPGRIMTAMTGPAESAVNQAALARIPARRFGTPDDVAAAIGFLASDQAGFINGAILDVNGGEFAPP